MKSFFISIVILSLGFSKTGFAKVPPITAKELEKIPKRIIRPCCAFGDELKLAGFPFKNFTTITSTEFIGDHVFLGDKSENNGIVYTHRGGFIDIAHLRDYADWTAYLYNYLTFNNGNLIEKKLGNEAGAKILRVDLSSKPSKEEILRIAGSIAHDLSLWHEISTWFGATVIPLVPEKYSSFSPEDQYSNLLGVILGMEAIQSDLPYNEAMTKLLKQKLSLLECVESLEETKQAFSATDQIWWDSEIKLPSQKVLKKRYISENETLLPWMINNSKNGIPLETPIKKNEALFTLYTLNIKSNYRFKKKELEEMGIQKEISNRDFPTIISFIKKQIVQGVQNRKK